jgi:8-oxo-dGTP pyrophosphatase MutT (NUDIX family)
VRRALEAFSPADASQERLRREFLARFDEGPDALRREGRPSHLTASGLVLDASRRSVLLVLHRKVGLWLQPGGHLEDGDQTLAAAALRESVEETGVADLELLDDLPVHLDRHTAPCGAEQHLDVRFVLGARDGAVPLVSDESLDVAWFPLDALPRGRSECLSPLLHAALRVAAVG